MSEIIEMDELKNGIRKEKFKRWVVDKVDKAKIFWDENKEAIVIIVPAGVALFREIGVRSRNQKVCEDDKRVYDPQIRYAYECRRKVTPAERNYIEARRKNGESVYDILRSMRLIR